MQALAILGLIIVSTMIYFAITWALSSILNGFNSDLEAFAVGAWIIGWVCFVVVVLFWATEPFPVSMG